MRDDETLSITVTPESFDRYLGEVDPILRRLEAVTGQLADARVAVLLNGPGAAGDDLITVCDGVSDALRELSNALVDAKGRLCSLLPPKEDQ